ncbi:ParA family protein [Atopomonas sediminilitoris]|uniref:ParA family protein n=1 Tax=Atopomonas sediminilitoris TaxID=2919919 RepID=UPI001F4E610E|nr:ParA family protein [Atopomonas sediminilitoris]MCJ8170237.1 ParA family protein [Atopomonas sediminilitoris]
MMKRILVANAKGGCGKTTLATQIASHFAAQDLRVLLADYDPQRSASDWLRNRPTGCAPLTLHAAWRLPLPEQGYDVLVGDMPAAIAPQAVWQVLKAGDKLLIPILPSPSDIKASLRFLMALNLPDLAGAGVEVGLVANRVRSNTEYTHTLHDLLAKMRLPLVASIRDTQNYVRAMDHGVSIFDLPAHRVRSDLAQWDALLAWLDEPQLSALPAHA